MNRLAAFLVLLFFAAGWCPGSARGQGAAETPAPLPAQLFSAKTMFISNTTGRESTSPGISEHTYNEFYAAMKSWGRYKIVTAPADAELVFELRYATALGPPTTEIPVSMRNSN